VKRNRSLRGVKKLLLVQLMLCLLISIVVLISYDRHQGLSALLGGLVAFVPSMLFARKCFKYQGARAAKQIVKSFYAGEFLKIFASILLFTLVFLLYEVAPLAFFLTYIVILMTHWFAPLIIDNKQNGPKSD
jgi:ATP synthase protein I